MIIAVDFDGTIVEHMFPEIGKPLPGAVPVLKALKKAGHQIFLWTMRGHPDFSKFPHVDFSTGKQIERDTLQEALDFCKKKGIEFDRVNESPAQFSTSLKQYANYYIDDAAAGAPYIDGHLDWKTLLVDMFIKGILKKEQVEEILQDPEWNKI